MKLLFVCMGNICRSPAAECVMRTLLRKEGLESEISCDSAGTLGYHEGEGPDSRMITAGRKRGFQIAGSSRPIIKKDIKEFDLIITMDNQNYENVIKLAKFSDKKKVVPFCNYVKNHSDTEVPDPYYGGIDGFDYVIDLLFDGCQEILNSIKQKN